MTHVVTAGPDPWLRLYRLLERDGGWYTRGSWQSHTTALKTLELGPVVLEHNVSDDPKHEQEVSGADMPWAEDHFAERIGGLPLNPAPSFLHWPWHGASHAHDHVSAGVFDHTYPERMWPRLAGPEGSARDYSQPLEGVRYEYGDLSDVVALLGRDPFTRQAYLPIWFPEDTGSRDGQRVPCSLGYHFLRQRSSLDLHYTLRSCDLTRHFRNDLYLASRLLQYVAARLRMNWNDPWPTPGKLYITINNLHVFEPDLWRYR